MYTKLEATTEIAILFAGGVSDRVSLEFAAARMRHRWSSGHVLPDSPAAKGRKSLHSWDGGEEELFHASVLHRSASLVHSIHQYCIDQHG